MFINSGNTDWFASAGTSEEDSEWIVLDNEVWDNLGSHDADCPEEPSDCLTLKYTIVYRPTRESVRPRTGGRV